jgi:hypothetical protein
MGSFDAFTELRPTGDGTFLGVVSAAWTIGGRRNGGYQCGPLVAHGTQLAGIRLGRP